MAKIGYEIRQQTYVLMNAFLQAVNRSDWRVLEADFDAPVEDFQQVVIEETLNFNILDWTQAMPFKLSLPCADLLFSDLDALYNGAGEFIFALLDDAQEENIVYESGLWVAECSVLLNDEYFGLILNADMTLKDDQLTMDYRLLEVA